MTYNPNTMSFDLPDTDKGKRSGRAALAGPSVIFRSLLRCVSTVFSCLTENNAWVSSYTTVYIAGLPPGTDEAAIAEYFGSIGVIKMDKKAGKKKISMYRDKATGELKGDALVTYEDPFSAASAVQWFNDKEWKGAQPALVKGRP